MQAFAREQTCKLHIHMCNPTTVFLKMNAMCTETNLKMKQHLCSVIQRNSLYAESSFILQIYFFFLFLDTIVKSYGSSCDSQRETGRQEDKHKSKQEASLVFNSPMKPSLPQQGLVLYQQGSIASTSMNMSWTIFFTLLPIWRQEELWMP